MEETEGQQGEAAQENVSSEQEMENQIRPVVTDVAAAEAQPVPINPIAYFTSQYPSLTVQHSEKVDGEMKDFSWQFENGVLKFMPGEEDDLARFERATSRMHASVKNHIKSAPSRDAAEKIALAHREAVSRQTQAHKGPITAGAMINHNPEAIERQIKSEAALHGAVGGEVIVEHKEKATSLKNLSTLLKK